MPLAAKRKTRAERETPPQVTEEPSAAPQIEEIPEPPKVTVLISSYNNAQGLRRCLAALERSTHREKFEIVVVDKGSQDESPRLDSEFPEITFLRLPRNFGNTKALNIGMRTGVGEFVFFLSPEIEVEVNTVSLLTGMLEADEPAVALCPLIVDTQNAPVEQAYRLPAPETGAGLEVVPVEPGQGKQAVEYASFEAMMARKYFIRGINYLDERYGEFGADAELCYQIQRAGRELAIVRDVRVVKNFVPLEISQAGEVLLEADRAHGIAVFLGKHYGFLAGLVFRIKMVFKALLAFRLSLMMALMNAQKVDGSQSTVI